MLRSKLFLQTIHNTEKTSYLKYAQFKTFFLILTEHYVSGDPL